MTATRKGASLCPTDRPLMNVEPIAAGEQYPFLENLAADLTDVVYRVALRHGLRDKWLELQLDLWGALTEAIEKRSCLHPMRLA
jgi:hypothetical protein